ncbi:MAG TPA: hypothetical protein VGM77_06035 [Gemmatimonadales bacterium]|jgi:hypothetical protein
MDPCAELTLRLIRTGQEALGPRSSTVAWTFFPEIIRANWSEARDILAAAPKPALITPLIESGAIAMWSMDMLGDRGRASLEHQISNQVEYYGAKLHAGGMTSSDAIETPDGEFRVSVDEFRQWTRDYCINVIGVGLGPGPTPGTGGRLLVRPPGGHQAPVGWVDPSS